MKTIGIIGGGQLGLMTIEQAHLLGAKTICLDPTADSPAFRISDEHIIASFDDEQALQDLCRRSDIVTYEFENVSGDLLTAMEKHIKQGVRPLLDSQDRAREKNNARENGLTPVNFIEVDDVNSLTEGVKKMGYPCIFKTRRLGYDGHGQVVLKSDADLEKAVAYLPVPAILEEFISFDFEVSIVMVSDGEKIISFPIGKNIHTGGILDLCIVPAPINDTLKEKIETLGKEFMQKCGYKGILTIEFFVKGDQIYFNEMAPRPHNSGHYTIEGCSTNQFMELGRFLLGMDLQEPKLVAPTIMKNILGQDLEVAEQIAKENHPNVYVHIYGKTESKPKRKMGHITFVGMDLDEYNEKWKHRFV
ncbi:MAG: 5-(carboxyamino)imidazole ribonucleotide synthase [Bacteroidales bacterium]|nr:5-(carboxyamino)imidazole ribonucleotide synthase [Bacteroidales bacterium]